MIGSHMSTHRFINMRQIRGFSLVELLVTIAVIGLLLAIAVPTYREHVRRGAVEEALGQLGTGSIAIEQYFLDNRTYVGAPLPAGTARFAISYAAGQPTAATYTLVATGSGNVNGFVYTLNQQGVRATTGGDWGTNAACWIIRKGGTCGG